MRRIAIVLGATLLIGTMFAPAAQADHEGRAKIYDFATGKAVKGAFSEIERGRHGIETEVRTWAVAGDAYTAWYVIFNRPGKCSDGACGEDDLFLADGSFNEKQIRAARIAVIWGKAGAVAKSSGRVRLEGGVREGEVLRKPGQIVIGRKSDGALVPLGVVSGLENSRRAEIHIVVQGHGKAHQDPALLKQQLTTFQGACNPDCIDLQFAVHLP